MAEPVMTSLPILKEGIDTISQNTFELGMTFANKPLSLLTPEHGFAAELRISAPEEEGSGGIPAGCTSVSSDTPRFRRIEKLKKLKEEISKHSVVKAVRCIIDESSDYTIASKSAVGVGSAFGGDQQMDWTAELGSIHRASSFLGAQNMSLAIHGRLYCMEVWVVEELFPGHEGVDIQIVLGKDFLRLNPGLVLEPVFRGDAVDLIPWNSGYKGEDFEVNSKGELIAYVSGHEETIDSGDGSKSNRGYFGVFFRPNSDYNMSMQCTTKELPLNEAAVVDGAMCVVFTALMGRMVTFTSIRIRTDARAVADMLNPDGKLLEYEERNWKTKKGKKLNLHQAFKNWAKIVRPELDEASWPWIKKDVLIFEKVDKKAKGLQAARHLAQSGRDSCPFSTGDRGALAFKNKKEWKNKLFTHIPSGQMDQVIRIRHSSDTFLQNRRSASDKIPSEESFTPLKIAMISLATFFPREGIISVIPFARGLEKDKPFSALQVLAISEPDFIEEVLKIAKRKGVVRESVELLCVDDGEFRFSEEPDEESAEVVVGLGLKNSSQ